MKLTHEQYRKVQQYLDDEMTPEQQANFLKEVNADASLQEYLQFEIDLRFYSPSLAQTIVKNSVPIQPPNEIRAKEKKIMSNLTLVFAIAASILITVVLIFWVFVRHGQTSPIAQKNKSQLTSDSNTTQPLKDTSYATPIEVTDYAKLYQDHYRKDPIPQDRSELIASLQNALLAYNYGKYEKLQSLDLPHLAEDNRGRSIPEAIQKSKALGYYYKGISFIETNDNEQALANLQWVIEHATEDKQLWVKANWYKALVYLKQGNLKTAASFLTIVSKDTTTPFGKKSLDLLRKLQH